MDRHWPMNFRMGEEVPLVQERFCSGGLQTTIVRRRNIDGALKCAATKACQLCGRQVRYACARRGILPIALLGWRGSWRKNETGAAARGNIPDWVRWLAILWLAVWFPVYWHAWGVANFLHLCDVAVILTCIGLWTGNALLLSSQAVSSVVIDALWTMDVAAWLLFRRHFIGGTEYLFDGTIRFGYACFHFFTS